MVKLRNILIAIFLIICSQALSAKGLSGSSVGLKGGFSLIHNYDGRSLPGFNIKLSYDPYLDYSINIDTSVFVHYAKDGLKNLIYPGFTVGTRYNVNVFPVTKLFIGSGLAFIAGIDYFSKEDEVDAFFSPGFYLKLGSVFLTGKYLSLGLETEYIWSMTHLNHIFSVNFRIDLLL